MRRLGRGTSRSKFLLSMTLLVIGIALVGATSGAVFLKIDGIDGESLDQNHQGWIDVDGFNLGVTRPSVTSNDGTRSTAAANFQGVMIESGVWRG